MEVIGHQTIAEDIDGKLLCIFFGAIEEFFVVSLRLENRPFFRAAVVYMVAPVGNKYDSTCGHIL